MEYSPRSKKFTFKPSQFYILESLIIILLAIIPLFAKFPYRVNIYLSWEGAYRLYQGQVPFKDFGMPTGFGFWLIPALFFKFFGPNMITLVKAQVLVNIISGFSFRSILSTLKVNPGIRTFSVLLFCVSYSFFNFWPWYNHTVIVYEFVGLAFTLKYIFDEKKKWKIIYSFFASFFIFLSIFTKQDGGGMAFMLCLSLVVYSSFIDNNIKSTIHFIGSFSIIAALFIIPLLFYDFTYWFNYGQPPHNSRLSISDVIYDIMGGSPWIKFYLVIIVLIIVGELKEYKAFFFNKEKTIFSLMTLGILVEATLFQVTSYTPPDNNIFFHSFAFVFIISNIKLSIDFSKKPMLILGMILVLFWWSGVFWGYIDRIMQRLIPENTENTAPDVISKRTYMLTKRDSFDIDVSKWIFSDIKEFKNIYMPEPTVRGMERILNMDIVKNKKNIKVLNLTELTPLANTIGYKLETGPFQPLWYHKGVGIFQREIDNYCQKIEENYYDLVLFEYVPSLNNFFPFEIRNALKKQYYEVDSFVAPRRPTNATIEVFIKK